jgi:hypothetical protein
VYIYIYRERESKVNIHLLKRQTVLHGEREREPVVKLYNRLSLSLSLYEAHTSSSERSCRSNS